MLNQSVYSVGTAAVTVVAPTNDYARYVIENLQPNTVDEMARDGFIYVLGQQFTIAAGGTALFSMATGDSGAQLDFYTIISDTSQIFASLIEGASVTVTGNPITAYNLNRNKSDSHAAVLKAATAVTGGTVISSEFVTASVHAGAELSSRKIHTLKPNATYAMRFVNQGNQSTNVYFQLGFSEQYNGYNTAWLGTVGGSYAVRPGESLSFDLLPNETINATAAHNGVRLSVLRQE